MVIEDLASGIFGIPGFSPDELVGSSLLDLVDPAEVERLVRLPTSATAKQQLQAQHVHVRLRKQAHVKFELLLAPKVRGAGYAFTIISTTNLSETAERVFQATVEKLPVDAHTTRRSHRGVPPRNRTLLARLTNREREIVIELLNGNRVPAIARKLYLAPGTVRNHLSSAYSKLGVATQQELIDLLGE
jgi:DNA-binding NarL/FixJ family response regulator